MAKQNGLVAMPHETSIIWVIILLVMN